jgi:SAM-dependent methyltransferase
MRQAGRRTVAAKLEALAETYEFCPLETVLDESPRSEESPDSRPEVLNVSRDSQERVATFFDSYADTFSSIYHAEQRSRFQRILDRLTRRSMFLRVELAGQLLHEQRVKTVLDVGCGPGEHDVMFASELGVDVLGIDIAPHMVELARDLARRHAMEHRCEFLVGDFAELALNQKYDACVSFGVLEYIRDPVSFLRKMIGSATKLTVFSLPVKWHPLTPQRMLRYKMRRCPLRFYSKADLVSLLLAAGAEHYRIESIGRDFVVSIDCHHRAL